MIKTEAISPKALRLTAPEKFRSDDFQKLALQVDPLIRQHNNIRLLIDASKFHGWENLSALKNHVAFIKAHHRKVERIALIAAHKWQHWLIRVISRFVHPEVRAYDKSTENEALQWIVGS